MLTRQSVHKAIDEIPVEQLGQVLAVAKSLKPKSKKTNVAKKKYLSYAGMLSDLSKKDYQAFINKTKKTREALFQREVQL